MRLSIPDSIAFLSGSRQREGPAWYSEGMKTDEELAAAGAAGDDAAFQELMRRNMRRAFDLAHSYARSEEDAEDIVQDSFFKSWRYLRRFDPSKRFSPWLLTIVRNTALDFLKKRRGIAFSALDAAREDANGQGDGLAFSETLADAEPLADELFARAENAELVTRALETLHPDHRSALMLHYRDGMTFEEISIVVDAPMNTVKSWHRRSLIKLKGALHREGRQARNR